MKPFVLSACVLVFVVLGISVFGDDNKPSQQDAPLKVVEESRNSTAKIEAAKQTKAKARKFATESVDSAPASNSADVFGIAMESLGEGRWAAIRWELKSGKSWNMVEGSMLEITEPAGHLPAPNSRYDIKLVQTRVGRIGAIRMDVRSGKTWHLQNSQWLPTAELK